MSPGLSAWIDILRQGIRGRGVRPRREREGRAARNIRRLEYNEGRFTR